ncbi:MAG TPA: alanine--tRNA ligase-related protein, partial [Chloroflexota bacterium]
YSYLHDRHRHIEAVVQQDEERFLKTLERGLVVFEEMAARAATNGNTISGKDTFVLSDTHGFPLELSEELAATRGLSVDREGFNEALRRQQERARSGRAFLHQAGTSPEVYALVANRVGNTTFTGYDELTTTTEIAAILAEGREVIRAEAGDQVEVILAATPFYAESGGQVGDTGVLHTDNGLAEVEDTQRPHAALIVHRATIHSGSIAVGDVVEAEVDAERRIHILPHHSGTHLLHKALQEVLGPEAVQAGSLVAPDRLRFDFRWPRPLSQDELREVQDRVNAAIWANLPVRTDVESYEDAVKEGAMALFGEKYGDRVRVVRMGNWSKELCGGTHVNATGDIGLLVVVGETGIGSGVRRVEALAGAAAYAYLNGLRDVLTHAAGILETQPENLENRAQLLVEELRDERKRVSSLAQRLAAREAESLLAGGIPIDGFTVVADKINADSDEYLDATVDAVRARLERGIVVLATVVEGRPSFRMAVTRNLRDAGYEANTILRKAAAEAQGGAGGSPEFARGGGRDASKVDQVLQAAVEIIRERAKG